MPCYQRAETVASTFDCIFCWSKIRNVNRLIACGRILNSYAFELSELVVDVLITMQVFATNNFATGRPRDRHFGVTGMVVSVLNLTLPVGRDTKPGLNVGLDAQNIPFPACIHTDSEATALSSSLRLLKNRGLGCGLCRYNMCQEFCGTPAPSVLLLA